MGRGGDQQAQGGGTERRAKVLLERVEDSRLDVFETKEDSEGTVTHIQAAICSVDHKPLARGEMTEVGIPGDEESYDAALGYSCSTAELRLQNMLTDAGVSEELAEELVELEINRSDMPVY